MSSLLSRLPMLADPFELHWLSNLFNLGSNKEIQSEFQNHSVGSLAAADYFIT